MDNTFSELEKKCLVLTTSVHIYNCVSPHVSVSFCNFNFILYSDRTPQHLLSFVTLVQCSVRKNSMYTILLSYSYNFNDSSMN